MPLLPSGPDPVEQMTARIAQLNETLRLIEAAASNPMLQSKPERTERASLRREVYAELERCCAPPPVLQIAQPSDGHVPGEPLVPR